MNETPLAVNLGTLIAHGSVRSKIMGLDNRAPTLKNRRNDQLVEQSMNEGALGLSTGLIYLPGTFAKTEEVVELAKVAAKQGGVYATHMRDEGEEVVAAIEESIKIGELANIPVEISHFKFPASAYGGKRRK
jgi:N-acyl-D-amino-acid deacylase